MFHVKPCVRVGGRSAPFRTLDGAWTGRLRHPGCCRVAADAGRSAVSESKISLRSVGLLLRRGLAERPASCPSGRGKQPVMFHVKHHGSRVRGAGRAAGRT
jgi:hypothetical protein